ncbi:hypothetical protein [Arthrobacter humicola]|uniref:Uncharacterized protein n=1 Tax=Arthrobacter humicola TaxID=409291 RepID=A0ABP5L175_9MICC
MRRKIMTALFSIVMLVLGTVALASPAQASSGGTFCFRQQNDDPFMNKPVSLELSADGNNWYNVLTLQTDESGCGWYTLTGDYTQYYVRVTADWWWTGINGELRQHWTGFTIAGSPGTQYDSLGSNIVICASVDETSPCY